jgi:peptide/nickel transport system substrate-binding protein
MKRRIVAVLCAVSMAAALAAGCGDKEANDTKKTETTEGSGSQGEESGGNPGVFVQAVNYMPTSLQPSTASDDQTTVTRPIYDSLFAETRDGREYYLADSLEISEDGKTYTLHFNDKATWSDGEPIGADDFLFSVEYGALSSGGRSSVKTVNNKEVTLTKKDDKTIEFVLPEPFGTYTMALARMTLLPAHVFDNDPSKVDDSGYFNSADMVTSGAYTVKEINEDSIVYEARDDYYRGTPSVKQVIMKTIGQGSTKQIAFENNEINYLRITTADEVEKYKGQSDKYNMYTVSEARLNYLQVNPYGPADLSENARKAIFLALDQDEILEAAYGSDELVSPANSVLTPDQSLYDPDCKGFEQDLEEAKKLAESSGLTDKPLVYIYNADRPNMEEVAVVIQQQLAAIGVEVNVEGVESSAFFQRFFAMLYKSGQENTWDLGTNGWDSERGPHLGQSYTYLNNSSDAWGWSEEIKQLAVKVNSAATEDDAKAAAKELQTKANEEYWEYPLTYTNYIMISQKYVTGLDGSSIIPEFNDYLPIEVK